MDEGKQPYRRATLAVVAAELGVSAKTVSNAFNRPDQLSPALRARVLDTARRLGYQGPDPVARGLRRGRVDAVGVLSCNSLSYAFSDPAAVAFLGGVSAVAETRGAALVLVPGSPPDQRDAAPLTSALVDGFVVYSVAADDPVLSAAVARGQPLVVVDQPRLAGVPWVGVDDEEGAAALARHLLELGHRRFGVVSFSLTRLARRGPADEARQGDATLEVTRRRLAGYRSALADAGLDWAGVPVWEGADSLRDEGSLGARALLGRDPRPTALLCLSDQLALGALRAAADLGLPVPADLSVVGFDDATGDSALTTVRQPHREKGTRAADLLFGVLDGDTAGAETVQLPTRLVVRGSTGPPC